jgi:hypothetical protein
MLKRLSVLAVILATLILSGSAATAERPPRFALMVDTLMLGDVIGVMHEEGIDYALGLEGEMFPGRGGATWSDTVAQVYDRDEMERAFVERLATEFASTDHIDSVIAFFGSERGQRILELELSARRAMLDDTVEEAARDQLDELRADDAPFLHDLRAFAEANELVESNVAGAMNSNFAFYFGLIDGGAMGYDLTEDQVIADVWGQEEAIRAETETWLYSYLALAYQPLDSDDLAAYTEFSLTPEGAALNRALFAAFDTLFTGISRNLGLAAARYLSGQDI